MTVIRSCCCVLVLTLVIVVWCPGTEAQCTATTYTAPVIPDSFLPFGTAADTNLPDGPDDGDKTSDAIDLSTPFRYYGYSFSKCYVSVNGLLSFNVAVAGQASTVQFSIDQVIIAPYWADIVLYNNDGSVYYRAITDTASSELQGLTEDIREKYATPFKFTAKEAVVVTWVNVTHQVGDCDSPVSTFQLVLVTDGRYSFVIFNYAGLGWNAGSAQASHPLVGFTVNTEYTFELPDSGTANVTDLALTSNVGQNGVWMFRVDTRPIVTELCEDSGDTLTLSPDVASPQGGSQIQLSGPCIASTDVLKVKIHGTEVAVTREADHRLKLIVPALWLKGEVLLELSRDDGTTYPLTANLLIDLDPDLVPVVTRVDAPSWEMEKDNNSITWDRECFVDTVNISIFFATYRLNDQDEVEEVLYPLLLEVPNNGQADIEVNGLPLLADADLKLVTFGSILIKGSQGASQVTEARLYSDIHVAMWYVRIFFIELVTRNKLDDTNPILPEIWNFIKNKFQMTNSQDEVVIKMVIKNGVIDLCTMWMSLLSQVGSSRCGSGQTNVAVSTPVPCARRQPLSDPGWTQYLVSPPVVECEQTQDRMCFIQSNPTLTGSSQQGCYKMADDKLLEGTLAGRPLSMHPHGALLEDGTKIPWMIGHMVNDVEPMLFCCVWDKSKCDNFRNVRPAATCTDYEAPTRGGGGGDPHYVTFDNVRYTFNGHGEFTLVKHPAGFEVQARLQARGDLKASETTALVSKVNNSDCIEIRSSTLTGLEVVIHGNIRQLVGRSRVPFNGGYMTLTFMRTELKSVVIAFTTGEEVRVKQDSGSLSFVIIPLISQQDNLEGLLGDYDGNKSNDFKPPTGAAISLLSTPQQIHNDFGVLWRTAVADSLFTYSGETHADFQDMDFVPTFQSADTPVPSNCSGDIFCAFDYNVTEDMNYALATKGVFDELQTIHYDFNSGRECPVLILDNGGFGSSRMAGDTVTATCVDGYEVDPATSRTRTCQLDLTWSGTDTICLRQARSCDDVVCNNNGTCIEENDDAVCKCAIGYIGSLCEEAVTDTKVVIIVGAVVGGLLLVAIIVAVCLITRNRPDPYTDHSSEIFRRVFGDVYDRNRMPIFRGTNARRESYNNYSYDNQGYQPTAFGNIRYNVEPRRYTRENNGYRERRFPYNGRPVDRGYPNDHSPHSDTEDSIDRIYHGDTEYFSHIDRRSPSDESFGRNHQPPPPPVQVDRGNWELRLRTSLHALRFST